MWAPAEDSQLARGSDGERLSGRGFVNNIPEQCLNIRLIYLFNIAFKSASALGPSSSDCPRRIVNSCRYVTTMLKYWSCIFFSL